MHDIPVRSADCATGSVSERTCQEDEWTARRRDLLESHLVTKPGRRPREQGHLMADTQMIGQLQHVTVLPAPRPRIVYYKCNPHSLTADR